MSKDTTFFNPRFGPEGKWLFANADGNPPSVRHWLVRKSDGEPPPLPAQQALRGFGSSPDGKLIYALAPRAPDTINVFHADTRKLSNSWRVSTGWFKYPVLSPRGDQMAAVHIRDRHPVGVTVWTVQKGELVHTLTDLDAAAVKSLAFSEDGNRLIVVLENELKTWDVATGRALGNWPLPVTANHLAFSHDAQWLAVVQSDIIHVLPTGKKSRGLVLRGHTQGVTDLDFSQDGKRLVSCSHDGTVRLWDIERELAARRMPLVPGLLVFDRQGNPRTLHKTRIIHGKEKTVFAPGVWDQATGKPIFLLEKTKRVERLAISEDGKYVAASGLVAMPDDGPPGKNTPSDVRIWETASGQLLSTVPAEPQSTLHLRFSHEGQQLIRMVLSRPAGSVKKTLHAECWDPLTGKLTNSFSLPHPVRTDTEVKLVLKCVREVTRTAPDYLPRESVSPLILLAVTNNARLLAVGRLNAGIEVWDLTTQQHRFTTPVYRDEYTALAFDPEGQRLATSAAGVVRLWDTDTGAQTLQLPVSSRPRRLMFSPDGQRLVADRIVWDAPRSYQRP